MVLNKVASSYFVALMLAVLFFFFGLAVAGPMTEVINESRTSLSCSTATDYWEKATCVLMDLMVPYFVGVVFALVGLLLGARVLT